jgi:hypothetical protein
VGDVALDQAQLAEQWKHLVVEAACVGVRGRVIAALADLARPDVGCVAEPGLGPQDLRALAALGPQLVLECEAAVFDLPASWMCLVTPSNPRTRYPATQWVPDSVDHVRRWLLLGRLQP